MLTLKAVDHDFFHFIEKPNLNSSANGSGKGRVPLMEDISRWSLHHGKDAEKESQKTKIV